MFFLKKLFGNVITPSPRGRIGMGVVFILLLFLVSCSEDEKEWDPYYNWQARNEAWFRTVADSARTAIASAKKQYGDQWQQHSQWLMLKRLDQSQSYDTGRLDDSICVRIISRGTGDYSPVWSDSVRISFRGWMMPTTYRIRNEQDQLVDSLQQFVFTQTYYGTFDPETAAPQLSPVNPFVTGFNTALQYMVAGDDWLVYVPARLAYDSSAKDQIPAYSTLAWRIHLAAVYPAGIGVPTWKIRKK